MEQENRVARELAKWKKIEERLKKSYSTDLHLNRAFHIEKLAALERIHFRCRKDASYEERIELRILKEQSRELQKKIYPNRWLRMIRSVIAPLIIARSEQRMLRRVDNGLETIAGQLTRADLGDLLSIIGIKVRKGLQNFSVPVTRNINGREQLHLDVRVYGSQENGYRLDGYKATLFTDGKDSGRSHHFEMDTNGLADTRRSGNLLAGRAVKNSSDGQWQAFDLNDKDANDNYRIRTIPDGVGFDLKAALKSLGITEKFKPQKMEELQSQLNAGNIISLPMINNPETPAILLTADGRKRGITAHDSNGRTIPPRMGKVENVGTIIRGIELSNKVVGKGVGR